MSSERDISFAEVAEKDGGRIFLELKETRCPCSIRSKARLPAQSRSGKDAGWLQSGGKANGIVQLLRRMGQMGGE